MNNQELQADLAKVAAEYNHSGVQQALLENYKDSILLLRAKYASYEKIAELFIERGTKVSVATIRKFCRLYNDEMLKKRADIQRDAATEEQPASSPDIATKEDRPPLTSEPGKRGPRTARDTL
jgi:hypothetical protein